MKRPTEDEWALLGAVALSLLFAAGLLTTAVFMIKGLFV